MEWYWGELGGFLATKIFILLKKIIVDVEKNNDIPQFTLMLPGEDSRSVQISYLRFEYILKV